MPKITVQPSGKEYGYEAGGSLLEILLAQKMFVDNPCNGKGVCGKCRVRIISGELNEPNETERKIAQRRGTGIRSKTFVSCETRR